MVSFEKINTRIARGLDENKYKFIWLIFFLSVILVLTLTMALSALGSIARFKYTFIYTWATYFIIIIGVIYFNLKVLVPRFLLSGKLIRYILSITGCIILIMLSFILVQYLYFITVEDETSDSSIINLLGNMLSIGMIIVSTSVYALFKGWADYSKKISELETSTKEAELQQLKSQINPHFLFNTINNANIKVEKEPQKSSDMITKLEELLRYQLTETIHDKVILKDDISFFNDYLELEGTRRSRFSYSIKAGDDVYDMEVYPLLFISFVENAVKHSLAIKGEAIINLAFTKENNLLHFYCENTKPTVSVKHKSGGLGLKNVKRRLELLYDNDYTLEIKDLENSYIVNLYLKI